MEVESVSVEDERRLTLVRFEAAVKVIKSLPPDGKSTNQSVFILFRPVGPVQQRGHRVRPGWCSAALHLRLNPLY